MRPHGQLAVSIERKAARRRYRCMRQITACISSLKSLLALRVAGVRGAEFPIDSWPLQKPIRLLLGGRRRLDILPADVIGCGDAGCFNGCLVIAEDGKEISVAHELDRTLGGAPNGFFIDRADGRAAIGLTHDAGVRHAVNLHVVDEHAFAEYFRRQIETRAACPDVLELVNVLASASPRRLDG